MTLLEIRNLRTHIETGGAPAQAVDGVDLRVGVGETVGVVGESGSGKTVLALSIIGLQPGGRRAISEDSSIRFRGEELVGAGEKRLRQIRGGEVGMVFQEPMTSLNPVLTVGSQIREAVRLHRRLNRKAARDEAVLLLKEAGLPDPEAHVDSFPHQLSGGMRQRVMIAMALAGEPSLLIADEPTTALDVTTEAQILGLLKGLQGRIGMGLILISHDLGVVARVCERVVVLYGGQVVEVGDTHQVLTAPAHPYTRGLMESRVSVTGRRPALHPIPGEVPEAAAWPCGCRFHPRCPEAFHRCRLEGPDLVTLESGPPGGVHDHAAAPGDRAARCWLVEGGKAR